MNRPFQILTGLAIFLGGVGLCVLLFITKPEAEKNDDKVSLPAVNVLTAVYEPVEVDLPSQGVIQSTRRIQLAAEVAGKIVNVNKKFESGESFAVGDVLLELEDSDYKAALAQAESTVADMEAVLIQEKARAAQAERDWKKLGGGKKPDSLVLRIPQLKSAEAKLASAEAMVAKAQSDLKRTKITAPFPVTISSTMVELGGFVSPGMPVAEMFQTSSFEVRLPMSIDDAHFLQSDEKGNPKGKIKVTATSAGITQSWDGEISRTEREIDRATRSLYIIASIDPKSVGEGVALQPGLFIQAKITGRTLPKATRIPFSAFLDLKRIVIVDENDELRYRDVEIIRRDGDDILVSAGVKEGERISLTELPNLREGVKVTPTSEKDQKEQAPAEAGLSVKP